jgi:fermentation-respiration switch protein FrsA (DUF1100 family)
VASDLGGAPDLDRQAERVRIPVGEDDHLDGWLLRGSRPGVIVLLHGYARDHHRLWRYAGFLRHVGWTVLNIDFRSARVHDRKPTTLGFWERIDAIAALDWVRAQPGLGRQPLALFGESLGGSVALVVAAERPDVAAVAADSPFANGRRALEDGCTYVEHVPAAIFAPISSALGRLVTGHDPGALDVLAALRKLGARRVLLIQSSIPDRFGAGQVQLLEQAAGPGAVRWTVADAGHNQAWERHRAEYERRVTGFFTRSLAPPTPAVKKPAMAAKPAKPKPKSKPA